MFEKEFEELYRKQLSEAVGQRRENLEGELYGTKKMLEVLYPVLRTLDGVVLEYEMTSLSGVKIYADALLSNWRLILEEEHFITHAQNFARKRFSFERARARSVGVLGYTYFPYGRDELETNPDECRRDLTAFIQASSSIANSVYMQLSVKERETLRAALTAIKPMGLEYLSNWLNLSDDASSKVARSLVSKGLLDKHGGGERRCHEFVLSEHGRRLLLG